MGILIRNNSVGTLSGIAVTNCDIHDVVGDMADYFDCVLVLIGCKFFCKQSFR
jgi:hypothetical protein